MESEQKINLRHVYFKCFGGNLKKMLFFVKAPVKKIAAASVTAFIAALKSQRIKNAALL